MKTKVFEVKVGRALASSGIYEVDYSLNPYVGCEHACTYCYVPHAYPTIVKDGKWGEFVKVKVNLSRLLKRELELLKDAKVLISSITDPYQPLEKRYGLTRACLKTMLDFSPRIGLKIIVLTKSPLFIRDLDLLSLFEACEVGVTITTFKLAKIFEPFSPNPYDRLKALQKASEVSLDTFTFLGPLLPTVIEEEAEELLDTIVEYGCRRVVVDKLRLRFSMEEALYGALKDSINVEEFLSKASNMEYFKKLKTYLLELCKVRKLNVDFCF